MGASGTNVYDLSGTLVIAMDFAAQTYTGTLTLSGTNDRTGESVAFGSFPLVSRTPYATPLNNIGAFIGSGRDEFRAKLAGSTAAELGGSFNLMIADPRAMGVTLSIVGAVVARR